MTAIHKDVDLAVKTRSNLLCEACAASRADHLHHRQLKSQGGKNTAENLLHVCWRCHNDIHVVRHDESYDRGLLVRSYAEPADVPVVPYFVEVPGE